MNKYPNHISVLIDIQNISTSINIPNIFGEIEMRVVSTLINISNIFGEIEMRVVSTEINIPNIFGEIEMRTLSPKKTYTSRIKDTRSIFNMDGSFNSRRRF
jgi:hypothetical protein